MKMRKFTKFILILFILMIPFCRVYNVNADSGWDSDYGSSSSWGSSSSDWSSSSSDWSSSSSDWGSSSSGSSSSHSSSSSSSGPASFIGILFFLIILSTILEIANSNQRNQNHKSVPSSMRNAYIDIDEEQLKEILPDYTLMTLKQEVYEIFKKVQIAWMNFDYDALRELCTDELCNSYISDLDVLKIKNGQNIMEDFQLVSTKIIRVANQNGVTTVRVYMGVKFKDYVINTNTKEVTRGNKKTIMYNEYIMEFVRDSNAPTQEEKCPNCGAPITENVYGKCEFCRSTIVKKPKNLVLSKKGRV